MATIAVCLDKAVRPHYSSLFSRSLEEIFQGGLTSYWGFKLVKRMDIQAGFVGIG